MATNYDLPKQPAEPADYVMKPPTGHGKPWFDEELEALFNKRHERFNAFRADGSIDNMMAFLMAHSEFKRAKERKYSEYKIKLLKELYPERPESAEAADDGACGGQDASDSDEANKFDEACGGIDLSDDEDYSYRGYF